MSLRRAALLVFPLALCATGSTQTILIRFRPPVGTKRSFVSTTTMTMSTSKPTPGMTGPMSFTTTTPIEMRVVKRAGTLTTMETKNGKSKVTLPPNSPLAAMKTQMESQGAGLVSTVTLDEFGSVKSMGAQGGGQAAAMSNQMGKSIVDGLQGVKLTKNPIKVGDTWSSSFDMGKVIGSAAGAAGNSQKMPMSFRLASIENKGGKRVARITMSMKGSMKLAANGQSIPISMNMSGYSLIEVDTGLTVGTSMTSDSTFSMMGNTMKQHMVMSMTSR